MDHDDGEVSPPAGLRAGRFAHLAGAVGSVALVAGLMFWGYELAVRDVHGIPVVRALEGPMRVAPAAPGGEVTEHQGLAVNQVAASGVAAPLPDTVTLAPRPQPLAEEDVAGLMAQPAAQVTAAAAAPSEPVIPAEAATAAAIAAALAEATAEVPLAALPEASATDAAPAALRPRPRPPLPQALPADPPVLPAASDVAPALAEVAPAPAAPAAEVDPATLAPGTVLIQLDAFDSEADARAAWSTIASRFPAEFADKALLLDQAESGGVPFWRLRAAGFDGVGAARSFCEALRTGGATCIPVAHE
jgi:hypothetical protein